MAPFHARTPGPNAEDELFEWPRESAGLEGGGSFYPRKGRDVEAPLMLRCVESPPHQKQGDNAYAGGDNRMARGAATARNATPVSTRGPADDDQRQQECHVQPSKLEWMLEH
ncbi:hypothetical protein CUR178_05437 [Leishmania enriettii]|uniref:Uncharacterized protein n=1 Tax=Leishmania enriettii TaxID=5663 RepID=A0A836GBF0_LEIEN|nr:hypothetical protein CUR178_05437 [Leishmania enriettii]